MKRTHVQWMLAAINAALLVGLIWKFGGENTARAAQAAGGRGDYVIIPARVPGATNGVVYAIDTRRGLLSYFMYDNNRKELVAYDPIDIGKVFENSGVIPKGGRRN